MEEKHVRYASCSRPVAWCLFAAVLLYGCNQVQKDIAQRSEPGGQEVFVLQEIALDQGKAFLDELGLGTVSLLPDRNAVSVTGSPRDLLEASVVLELVDAKDEFVIEKLGPASIADTLPTNDELAKLLGNINIGTFADPPQARKHARAIIDVHGDAVVAIVPARFRQDILTLVQLVPKIVRDLRRAPRSYAQADRRPKDVRLEQGKSAVAPAAKQGNVPKPAPAQQVPQPAEADGSRAKSSVGLKEQLQSAGDTETVSVEEPQAVAKSVSGSGPSIDSDAPSASEAQGRTAKPPGREVKPTSVRRMYQPEPPANGDDILELDLPNQIEIIQLLDLVAEYLDLDYLYDPNQIKGEAVTLKFRGKLQGEVRVKDLHPLLESVLKFKGFVMTRHQGSLVTIVRVEDALRVDPVLMDPKGTTIRAGDMVVTRVFALQHVDTSSATNLLENMKLSVAVSPIEETRTLIVTCYAHRMGRIERLLNIIDNPGRPKKFRFRRLKYTTADMLAGRLETLADELQTVPVTIAPAQSTLGPSQRGNISPARSQAQRSTRSSSLQPSDRQTAYLGSKYAVYLDADERTNRILMIGYEEQLVTVEELIDALDVPQQDVRTLRVYDIEHVDANVVRKKLEELEIIGKAPLVTRTSPTPPKSATPASTRSGWMFTVEGGLVEEPQVVVLEVTNSLLVNATEEQHAQIETIISHVDVVAQDPRTLRVYDIEHVDAEEVKRKLEELEVVGKTTEPRKMSLTPPASKPPQSARATDTAEGVLGREPQVVVLEATNSVLIKATEHQHAEIEGIIKYVDAVTREQAIPYKIYFLENQEPEHLAGVLEKIIQETITDKEGKIEKVIKRTDEQIVLVPDEATFSLIVYANKKNQEWIGKLIETLDIRRPQVLIDATLVEIRKTDEFNYDLNLISSFPDLVETGGQTGSFLVDGQSVVEKLLEPGMRDRFIDLQADAGAGAGFYADRHINVLLRAMQTKNYGRVLAKPKILVNDNETGTIKTTDTTYVEKKTSIPVVTGAAGQQSTLIETAIDFEPFDAGITLEITPHISEGELLRLEITLTRSDFGIVTGEKPPDQTSSDVSTVVTVPDGSTIILGGMLRLNQSKGGSKVPILGDLPLVGGLFRSIATSDIQSKLYVFVRAEIIRPAEALADVKRISERNRAAFEKHEAEFQKYENWPGLKPRITEPEKVLEAH